MKSLLVPAIDSNLREMTKSARNPEKAMVKNRQMYGIMDSRPFCNTDR